MKQSDDGSRNRLSDTAKYKIKDNWWWVLPIVLPITYALISDHFTLSAIAGDVTKLDNRIFLQVEKQEKRQAEINKLLKEQAEINGRNSAMLEVISEQNRLIQRKLSNWYKSE